MVTHSQDVKTYQDSIDSKQELRSESVIYCKDRSSKFGYQMNQRGCFFATAKDYNP